MSLERRLERLELASGANACPCRAPKLIEIVDINGPDESAGESVGCERCGEALPVSQILALNPLRGIA
jgi:hypothetical protein